MAFWRHSNGILTTFWWHSDGILKSFLDKQVIIAWFCTDILGFVYCYSAHIRWSLPILGSMCFLTSQSFSHITEFCSTKKLNHSSNLSVNDVSLESDDVFKFHDIQHPGWKELGASIGGGIRLRDSVDISGPPWSGKTKLFAWIICWTDKPPAWGLVLGLAQRLA